MLVVSKVWLSQTRQPLPVLDSLQTVNDPVTHAPVEGVFMESGDVDVDAASPMT